MFFAKLPPWSSFCTSCSGTFTIVLNGRVKMSGAKTAVLAYLANLFPLSRMERHSIFFFCICPPAFSSTNACVSSMMRLPIVTPIRLSESNPITTFFPQLTILVLDITTEKSSARISTTANGVRMVNMAAIISRDGRMRHTDSCRLRSMESAS